MAWSYRKNATHRNSEKDVRKTVCNKTKRKTKNEMAGWRVHGPKEDGNKRMERQSKGSRGLEAYCKGGQGPRRAVAPSKKKNLKFLHVKPDGRQNSHWASTDFNLFMNIISKFYYCLRMPEYELILDLLLNCNSALRFITS